jgi:Protein of unknown function (DUF2971)
MIRLYKFIANPDDVQYILAGEIKFTPIRELNDPSELQPNVIPEDVRESLSRLRNDGYSDDDISDLHQQEQLLQRLAPSFLAIGAPATKEQATAIIRSSFYDNLPALERILARTAEEISLKIGVLCLTRRNDSLPMWAHYAAGATGLVVEFRNLDDVFRGDETGVLSQPTAVRYEREQLGISFDPRSHRSLFFSKFPDWSYEEEVRVVLPLSDCRQTKNSASRLHIYDVPKEHVARVILGWRAAPSIVDKVTAFVRSINPDVEVVQMQMRKGRLYTDRPKRS